MKKIAILLAAVMLFGIAASGCTTNSDIRTCRTCRFGTGHYRPGVEFRG
jgi:hypothetical protein